MNDLCERSIRVCALFQNGLTMDREQKTMMFRGIEDYRHHHVGRTKAGVFGIKSKD